MRSAKHLLSYLPVKSVGVVGDERRYADVIALRSVETVGFYDS